MSRYECNSDGLIRIFGWDDPLQTFFVQVWKDADGDENALLWAGTTNGEIPTIVQLDAVAKDYGGVPATIQDELAADYAVRRPPSELQRIMTEMLIGRKL